MHACMLTHAFTHMLMCTQSHAQACMHIMCTHPLACTFKTHTHRHNHSNTPTARHTCAHTHTHTHRTTQTPPLPDIHVHIHTHTEPLKHPHCQTHIILCRYDYSKYIANMNRIQRTGIFMTQKIFTDYINSYNLTRIKFL